MRTPRPFAAAAAAVACFVIAASGAASAETNLLLILDGSNSMWGKVEGRTKIESAQSVLTKLLSDLPTDTNVGLMIYGHTSKDSCNDIEIVSSIGADTPQAIAAKIKAVQPKGKTPIAGALFGSTLAFRGKEGENNHVVLISDGIETCGGDPCMAASVLANANIQPRVHVVGFDVNAEERAQLECIPKMGNGQYFSAANAEELKDAITQVAQVVEKAPEPKKGPEEIFRDDFDGEDLGEHWEVLNPNPDTFIVEDGALLIVSGTRGSMNDETVENTFTLSEPLPKGDWTITAKFSIEFQTGAERAYIGVFDNGDNYLEISAHAFGWVDINTMFPAIDVVGIKRSKGKDKVSNRRVWDGTVAIGNFSDAMQGVPQPILLRLEKKGHKYIGSLMFEGAEEPQWVSLDKFTSLRRPKGKVVVGLYQGSDVTVDSTAMVDWVKIEVPGE